TSKQKYFISLKVCLSGIVNEALMKKLIGLFVVILLASCGASRNTKTKQKIREHYPKTVQKTEYPNKEISSVAEIKPEIKEETETLEATSKVNVSRNSVEEYIDKYKSLAIENMREYKIPASIKMAQAILESGSGNGKLAREAHNHFGIKCKSSWTGKSVRHTDDAPDECFRMYDSVDRKSTRLNSSHVKISYAVFCLKKKI